MHKFARPIFMMTLVGLGCSSPHTLPPSAGDLLALAEDGGSNDAGRVDASTPDTATESGDSSVSGDSWTSDAIAADATKDVDECATDAAANVTSPSATGSAQCKSSTWSSGVVVPSASTGSDDVLGAITSDELTIAWMTREAGLATIHYADREATDAAFGTGQLISGASPYYAAERVALSPDGMRLIVVKASRKGFGEYTRTSRSARFSVDAADASFAELNALGLSFAEQEFFGDPIVSADDLTLYYSRYGGNQVQTIYASVRTEPVGWPVGSPLQGAMLDAKCGKRRRATGTSADGLTLFYWDDLSGSERAAFRPSTSSGFDGAIDIGPLVEAQPNAGCSTLYWSGPGTMQIDILQGLSN